MRLLALVALGLAALAGHAVAGDVPVVVELFSSEGCSSCPPADRLLSRLATTQPVAGARVIPLELHVDYWDDLGWADPFARAAFTARQQAYARGRDAGRVYTPAMIVQGGEDLVGSDERRARAVIAAAAKVPPGAPLAVRVVRVDARAITVEVVVGAHARPIDLTLAVTQAGLATDVRRGENSGRRLAHAPIVRALERAATLPPRTSPETRAITLPRPSGGGVRVVAFAQAPGLGPITGAADVAVP